MNAVPILATSMGIDGPPWWQVIGAFLVVTGLLLITMRLLSRLQGRSVGGDFQVMSVSNLGPRRAVESLRYGDEVLILYRSEGAMVLVDRKPLTDFEASQPETTGTWWDKLRPRSSV